MPFLEFSKRLLAVAETLYHWTGAIAALDRARRAKVARYAEAIAETLGRAARFSARLTAAPDDRAAQRGLVRELGRISGYLETLVGVLQHHLDGRKLAGVKRRLEQLASGRPRGGPVVSSSASARRLDRLLAAEGYFRALAPRRRAARIRKNAKNSSGNGKKCRNSPSLRVSPLPFRCGTWIPT
jgi:hypothetical protein